MYNYYSETCSVVGLDIVAIQQSFELRVEL